MLCADDISYINMRDNRITAFAVDGTSYPLPMSMNDLEQALVGQSENSVVSNKPMHTVLLI